MRALVVHEPLPGTVDLARAVAVGLAETCEVEVVAATDAPRRLDTVDLLVVAPSSCPRREGGAIERWLSEVVDDGVGSVAVLGTSLRRPRLPAVAAWTTQRRLRRRGRPIAAPTSTFLVEDRAGYVLDAEIGRARRWGRVLAAATAIACRVHRQAVAPAERVGTRAALTA